MDKRFDVDFHEEYIIAMEKKKTRFNLVWDIYIERRLMKMGIPPAIYLLKKTLDSNKNERETILGNFNNAVIKNDESDKIFSAIWDTDKNFTYRELIDFSDKLQELPEEKQNE